MRGLIAATLSLLLLTTAPVASADSGVRHEETRIAADAATVWYPAKADRRLPVALLLPGANVRRAHYARFAAMVADYGFVVVVPERYVMPGYSLPSEFALTDVMDWVRDRVADPNSTVGQLVDPTTLVVTGHSYGGAAALYAAADRCQIPFCFGLGFRHPPELKAVVGHGTNTTIGSTVDAVTVRDIPVMYINGADDGVSELDEAYQSFTSLSGAPSAAFVNLLGVNHFGLADIDNPPGAAPDLRTGTVSRAESIATAARWTAMWFLAQLGDQAAREYVYEIGPRTDAAVRVEIR
ncbi:alpha/beta hydrolase [Nocardia uniformis]|uniref:Alpha/beta hydrolase n=1 Tax=Nocardia uniformis TaxID=53432 RepID=A0A849BWM6_9NOCA|nr:alpha/beta fold hydrolase [Nocardia uniformis]NNH68505.1 alpha/beta hydrolase [Nocardia uniformis]